MEKTKKEIPEAGTLVNAKPIVPPECKEVKGNWLMACVHRSELIGGQKMFMFKKIQAWNGARTIGDWENDKTIRNPRFVKYNKNYYLLNEDKLKGNAWAQKNL